MSKIRLATVWLGGCAGCHMSLLDMDEWLFDLAQHVDLVYSPIADVKHFPENVDVTLVEGAVVNEEHIPHAHEIRKNSKLVIAFGDCAVTGNVPSMRNPFGDEFVVLNRAYIENADMAPQVPSEKPILPPLLPKVYPLHQIVPVDAFLRGCPPSAEQIRAACEGLLEKFATA